jgi:hypothetical protein
LASEGGPMRSGELPANGCSAAGWSTMACTAPAPSGERLTPASSPPVRAAGRTTSQTCWMPTRPSSRPRSTRAPSEPAVFATRDCAR